MNSIALYEFTRESARLKPRNWKCTQHRSRSANLMDHVMVRYDHMTLSFDVDTKTTVTAARVNIKLCAKFGGLSLICC